MLQSVIVVTRNTRHSEICEALFGNILRRGKMTLNVNTGKTVKSKGETQQTLWHISRQITLWSTVACRKKKEHSSVRSVQNEVSSRIYLMFFSEQKSQFHTNNFAAEKYRKYRYYRYFFFDIDIRYFFNIATAYM